MPHRTNLRRQRVLLLRWCERLRECFPFFEGNAPLSRGLDPVQMSPSAAKRVLFNARLFPARRGVLDACEISLVIRSAIPILSARDLQSIDRAFKEEASLRPNAVRCGIDLSAALLF